MRNLTDAVDDVKALAAHFDNQAEHYRQKKREAELREIWYMNRASALREAAAKVARIAEDYEKRETQ
jgi:hypothetical protein